MAASMETPNETTQRELVITHTLNAPRKKVFQVWTQAEHLQHWWGPSGYHLEVAQMDLRPGGTFLYSIQMGDGPKMWGKFVYQTIEAPERLVFVNSFSNEDAVITRAPFSATWPQEMLNSLTFEEQDGQTLLTFRVIAINATEEERKTFENGFSAMLQGFSGTFEKLTAYVENA